MLELTVRLVVSLTIVVGLLLLLARVGQRKFRGAGDSMVQVVHRQPLSRTSSVAVVAVGSRVLVLGTTEQQVSVLAELDPDEVDVAAGEEVDPGTTTADFATALDQALDASPVQEPAAIEQKPARRALPPRPQARPATKPPVWDPMLTIRAQAAVRPAHAPGRPETTPETTRETTSETTRETTSAVDAILAAVEAHQNGTALPPALSVLASETDDTTAPAKKGPKSLRRDRPSQQRPKTPGPLTGSVLSPDTWKQAIAAATSRRAS